jgi:tellurite resistance protein TehA-like permease
MAEFRIGAVLRTGFRVWKQNLIPFTLISVLIYAPAFVLRFLLASEDWELYMLPLGLLLDTTIAATITYGVVMDLHGTRPTYRDCVTTGFAQLLPVVGVVFVSMLAIIGGLFLLIVPGVIATLMLYVVVPVAIIEKPGVMASLRRSRELTHGHKGELFAIVLVVSLVSVGLFNLVDDSIRHDVAAFVLVGIEAILGSLSAVMAAVAYTALRHDKEGTRVPELAAAFARSRGHRGT